MNLADIRSRALEMMGRLAAGHTASPEDDALATDYYSAVYQNLSGLKLTTWGSSSAVPAVASTHVIALLANEMLPYFNVTGERAAQIMQKAAKAERELRRQKEGLPQTSTLKTKYY